MEIFLDLVVQIGHGFAGMPQSILVQPFGTLRAVMQVGVAKTAEGMIACLVVAGERVDVTSLLQSRVEMPTDDVRDAERPPAPCTKHKAGMLTKGCAAGHPKTVNSSRIITSLNHPR